MKTESCAQILKDSVNTVEINYLVETGLQSSWLRLFVSLWLIIIIQNNKICLHCCVMLYAQKVEKKWRSMSAEWARMMVIIQVRKSKHAFSWGVKKCKKPVKTEMILSRTLTHIRLTEPPKWQTSGCVLRQNYITGDHMTCFCLEFQACVSRLCGLVALAVSSKDKMMR